MIALIQRYHKKFHTGEFDLCQSCSDVRHYFEWAQKAITEEVKQSNGGKLPYREHR